MKAWYLIGVTGERADTILYLRHSAWYVVDPELAYHFVSKNKAIQFCKDIDLHDYRIIKRKADSYEQV